MIYSILPKVFVLSCSGRVRSLHIYLFVYKYRRWLSVLGCKVSRFDLVAVSNNIDCNFSIFANFFLDPELSLTEIWFKFLSKETRCCIPRACCDRWSCVSQQSPKFDELSDRCTSTNLGMVTKSPKIENNRKMGSSYFFTLHQIFDGYDVK